MSDKSVWHDDLLGRERDALLIYRLLVNRYIESVNAGKRGSYVLNIDARWGQGKTFLLKGMYRDVLSKGHPAVFINAWEHDFVDDPYSIVVSALDKYFKGFEHKIPARLKEKFTKGISSLRRNFGAVAIATGKEVSKTLAKKAFGEGGSAILEALEDDDKAIGAEDKSTTSEVIDAVGVGVAALSDAAIDKYAQQRLDDLRKTTDSIANFRTNLNSLLLQIPNKEGAKLPFFVFIDELDRCRPTYAISLLERIKHLFDVDGMTFVMATDTEQLSHSINNVYGNNFDSKQYLQRFFNRSYRLQNASFEDLAQNIIRSNAINISKWIMPPNFNTNNAESFSKLLAKTAEVFELTTRQFEQSLDILQDTTTIWSEGYPIELMTMYAKVCEYAKHRKIDRDTESESHKLLNNSSQWEIEIDNDTVALRKYLNVTRLASSKPMSEWMRDAASSRPAPIEVGYVYEYVQAERRSRMSNFQGSKEPITNLANYEKVVLNNVGFFD
ncbi:MULTISPECIES: KAP family P-loop NTPase fold protein [Agrobacterium]|uniref:KAP family P-loop NTPase fold protein n=2 Tax=Rhizobium/Agrobacterium group TaxID=227290 RepID=UPI0013018105|nr:MULTISPECIES: P-loop NTPase fold protein [Agrobacterium]MEA1843745.1 P-loop NTPase fold protein [Agrobacterium tumefaciens]NSY92565.1 hypothetical protein [Agrobacterium tumefaciens]NTA44470.1 hypothetical protein [Agrobacterium tumefaciens]UZX44135.1 KAP family NTPase [Agrobacterium sp. 13-2099-1-2]WIE34597.1 P-loop NTPase fold protein [Agrobacterium tumefaciens]